MTWRRQNTHTHKKESFVKSSAAGRWNSPIRVPKRPRGGRRSRLSESRILFSPLDCSKEKKKRKKKGSFSNVRLREGSRTGGSDRVHHTSEWWKISKPDVTGNKCQCESRLCCSDGFVSPNNSLCRSLYLVALTA